LLRFWINQKGVKQRILNLGFSKEFQFETCCYFNWWLFSDHTIIQGHHWVKHHMFDQMPLLVEQVDFWKSFNNYPNLNSNLNQKTCDKFWIPNSNSNLKLHFMRWTWVHTLHLALVYNTVLHFKLRRAQTKYLRWHSKLEFLIQVIHHRSTFNL
jgi:hypothetical protein